MKCKNCGATLNDNSQFCPNCGIATNNSQTMENNVSTNQSYNQTKPKNKVAIIIAVVVGIVFVIPLLFMLLTPTLLKIQNNALLKQLQTVETYPYTENGYDLNIPKEFTANIENGSLFLTDSSGQWKINLKEMQTDFDELVKNKEKLSDSSLTSNAQINNIKEERIKGIKYVVTEVTLNNTSANYIMAYVKSKNGKALCITAINQNFTIDKTILERLAPIFAYTLE